MVGFCEVFVVLVVGVWGVLEPRLGITDYADGSLPGIGSWVDARFEYRISGPPPSRSGVRRFSYYDIQGIVPFGDTAHANSSDLWSLKRWAAGKALDCEGIFLHAKANYASSVSPSWRNLDRFGVFEGSAWWPVRGIVQQAEGGSSFADVSNAASVPLRNGTLTYLAYEEPFMQVTFSLTTPSSGATISWEYWDGVHSSWAPLSPSSDTTQGLTQGGTFQFPPPSNWRPQDTFFGSEWTKWVVRLVVSGTSSSVFPVASAIRTDDWLRGGDNLCCGWSSGDVGVVVHPFGFKYNLNPPASASAYFEYQARVPFWAANEFIMNMADEQFFDGSLQHTWTAYAASRILTVSASYEGVMCDDAGSGISAPLLWNQTDWIDKSQGVNQSYALRVRFNEIYEKVKAQSGSFIVGLNSNSPDLIWWGDMGVSEYQGFAWQTGSFALLGTDTPPLPSWQVTMDSFLSPENVKKTIGYLIYADNIAYITPSGTTYQLDRANRNPMAAFTLYLIGMNEYTVFSYHSYPGYVYAENDHLWLKNGTVVRRSQCPWVNWTIEEVERWGAYFPAMSVQLGGPDLEGWNGGERDTAFVTAENADIVKQGLTSKGPIWRRDFVNAIVLHRPGYYDQSLAEVEGYSSVVELNGTYYPLRADGFFASPVTSIALRLNEGAILFKHPNQFPFYPPSSGNTPSPIHIPFIFTILLSIYISTSLH